MAETPAVPLSTMLRAPLVFAVLLTFCLSTQAAPTFTTPPVPITVTAGFNATFTVAASGSGALTYQWLRHGSAISGATDATLVLPRVSRSDADLYSVTVGDASGAVTSDPVRLEVAPTSYPTTIAPDLTTPLNSEQDADFGVSAIVPTTTGGFVAGGRFVRIGAVRRPGLVWISADGTVDASIVPPHFDGPIEALAWGADGKLWVGGIFANVGGNRVHSLVRLNADGTVDTTFNTNLVAGEVKRICVLPNGKLVLGGVFGILGVVRLNADGSIDTSFSSKLNASLGDLGVQSDGRVIVGSWIDSADPGVVRLNMDGSIDSTFPVLKTDYVPQVVTVASDDTIYVGAGFATIGAQAIASVAHVSRDGVVDTNFSPQVGFPGATFPGIVNTVAIQADGKILIGGVFDSVNGTPRNGVARLRTDGSVDLTFAPTTPASTNGSAFAVLGNGRIALGLYCNFVGSERATAGLLCVTASGAADSSVNYVLRSAGHVNGVIAAPGGKFLVFGDFNYFNDAPAMGVVRLNPNLTVDSTFNPAPYLYNATYATVLSDGRIAIAGLRLQLTGQTYTEVSDEVTYLDANGAFVASTSSALTGITWIRAMAAGPAGQLALAGSGTVGAAVTVLDRNGDPVWQHGGAITEITAVAFQDDGKVLAGGQFTQFTGTTNQDLVRFNVDGTFDSTFVFPREVSDGIVSIAPTRGGKIVVTTQNNGTLRLNANGSLDAAWQRTTTNTHFAAVVQPDDRVLTISYGDAPPYGGLIRLNADGTVDSTFKAFGAWTPSVYETLVLRDNGQVLATGVTRDQRFYASRVATAPTFTTQPSSTTIVRGGTATLSADATSPIAQSYQWEFNGQPIAGATSATYSISGFDVTKVGTYSVKATNYFGTVTSVAAGIDAPLNHDGRIINASVRTPARTGSETLIVGFSLGGDATGGDKPIVVRAVGPTLATFGVAGALLDPMLELYDVGGAEIDENDDWQGVFDFGSVGGFPFAGAHPKDSAIYTPYAHNGSQTMHVIAKPGTSGLVLAELYDATKAANFTDFTPRIVNCSARAFSGTGDNVLILGFVVGGDATAKILVRAAGPTLGAAPFNIAGVLADPKLEVYTGQTKLVENDNWEDGNAGSTLRSAFQSVGAFDFGAGAKDSAVILTLSPGSYSALVRGVNDSTGVAIVEVYQLP